MGGSQYLMTTRDIGSHTTNSFKLDNQVLGRRLGISSDALFWPKLVNRLQIDVPVSHPALRDFCNARFNGIRNSNPFNRSRNSRLTLADERIKFKDGYASFRPIVNPTDDQITLRRIVTVLHEVATCILKFNRNPFPTSVDLFSCVAIRKTGLYLFNYKSELFAG